MADMTPERGDLELGGPEPGDSELGGPEPGDPELAGPEPGDLEPGGLQSDGPAPGPPAPDGSAAGGRGAQREEGADALPSELIPSGFDSSYRFPDNSRRRIAGGVYVILGAAALGAAATLGGSILVNSGFVVAAAALILVGLYYIQAGQPLAVDEGDALVAAVRAVGFPVGHASARLGWRGLRSRPTWRILLYSADTPPAQRGIVLVDGVDGGVVAHFTEANPEDWSEITEDAATENAVAEGAAATEGVIDDERAEGAAPSGDNRSDSGPEGR